jgi:hypothetical protein
VARKKKKNSWFTGTHAIVLVAVVAIAIGALLLFNPLSNQQLTTSDNVAVEFGNYTSSVGFGNNYFAGACSEGSFTTRFYTMSGVSGTLSQIVVPIEVRDDPDAEVVGDVKVCKAELGGECIGDETTVANNFDFTSEWGFESGEKTIEVGMPFRVEAGSYYMVTVEGTMEKYVTYSMYKADVEATGNRYFHSAPGCSSSRPDVYVVYFWIV